MALSKSSWTNPIAFVAACMLVIYLITIAAGTYSREQYSQASDVPVVGNLLTKLHPESGIFAQSHLHDYGFTATVFGRCSEESMAEFISGQGLQIEDCGAYTFNGDLDDIPPELRQSLENFEYDDWAFFGKGKTNRGHAIGLQGAFSRKTGCFLIVFKK